MIGSVECWRDHTQGPVPPLWQLNTQWFPFHVIRCELHADDSYIHISISSLFPELEIFISNGIFAFCIWLLLWASQSYHILGQAPGFLYSPTLVLTHSLPLWDISTPSFLPIAPTNQLEETLISFFFWSPISINEQVQLSLTSKITQLLHTSLTNTTLVKAAMTLAWTVVMASRWPPCISAVIPFKGIWTIF